MASTGTAQAQILDVHGAFVRTSTEAAQGENATVHVKAPEGSITQQLSRLEQIVEYLKVLYR